MLIGKNKLCYWGIPKNSTSFISSHLSELNWESLDIKDINRSYTIFMVLRDPYQRWISGFVEEIYGQDHTTLYQKIIKDILNNDFWFVDQILETKNFNIGWHTKLQVNFMPHKFSGEVVYFKQENNLNFKLNHFLLGEGIKSNFLNLPKKHVRNNLPMYKNIENFLSDEKNSKYKESLVEYLKPDHDLINTVAFY